MNKVIELFEQNKQGGLSLQFPIFICVRTDKDEVNYE